MFNNDIKYIFDYLSLDFIYGDGVWYSQNYNGYRGLAFDDDYLSAMSDTSLGIYVPICLLEIFTR